jgi:mRNA interferase RelE/StbE
LYEVILSNRAEKRLSRLRAGEYERVLRAVMSLAEDPRPRNCHKLQGREGWRIRVGDYRVIYEVDDTAQEVLVVAIGHRKDVYR